METFMIVLLILLLQVILDAVGDGFRARGWQKIHHFMETIQIAIWLGIAYAIWREWLDFQLYYVWMYVLGRIWLFDFVINPILKEKLLYISKSSFDGVIYYWISRDGNPNKERRWPVTNTALIFKFLAFVWWVAWFFSNRDAIALYFGR